MKPTLFARRLSERARGTVATDYPLAGLTTYRVGGPAAVYFEPVDADDVRALLDVVAEESPLDILVLGRGSNVVVSDSGFPGVVVHLGMSFSWIRALGDDATGLQAGAATPLPLVANWAARRGLAGLEFAIAIPGSVGGGVRMNAGAHGGEVADTIVEATVVDLAAGTTSRLTPAQLAMSYRHSGLSDDHLVLDASFRLEPDDKAAVRARMEGFRRHRAETQPAAVQNAGSTFKNPPGDSAGRLVEAAGLKGFRVGAVSVSTLHANFFIADEGAPSQDVFDLVHEVRKRVRDASGIDLEPEVRFVGRFDGKVG